MKTFEYLEADLDKYDNTLEEYGNSGWELVASRKSKWGKTYIFKRETGHSYPPLPPKPPRCVICDALLLENLEHPYCPHHGSWDRHIGCLMDLMEKDHPIAYRKYQSREWDIKDKSIWQRYLKENNLPEWNPGFVRQ